MKLRTAVVGVGHLGKQHARVHATLAAQGLVDFLVVCDLEESTGRAIAAERDVGWTKDWKKLLGHVDAVSLAVPTESHCEIASTLLESGIHVLVEKPIAGTLEEAERMISAARSGRSSLQVGHLERFNPALVALRPYVRAPLYFEIHRIGKFTKRSLDIDVVLDLMIHDLDIVQMLVGSDVEVTDVRAVGIPILTSRVDAANARLEFANGAVANMTASRVGDEKIRKMRFFQPHDFVAVDYASLRASISNLAQDSADWPGVNVNHLAIENVEPLLAEIDAFIRAVANGRPVPVTGQDGKRALSLALRATQSLTDHGVRAGLKPFQ